MLTGIEFRYSDNEWRWCTDVGAEMDQEKNARKDTLDLVGGDGTHRIGLLGAYAYAAVTRIRIDMRHTPGRGDGGVNLTDHYGQTVDVMVSRFLSDPYLKVFPVLKDYVDVYVLVTLDEERRTAWVLGQASRERLAAIPRKAWRIWNEAAGPMRSLRWTELDPIGTPPPVPTRR